MYRLRRLIKRITSSFYLPKIVQTYYEDVTIPNVGKVRLIGTVYDRHGYVYYKFTKPKLNWIYRELLVGPLYRLGAHCEMFIHHYLETLNDGLDLTLQESFMNIISEWSESEKRQLLHGMGDKELAECFVHHLFGHTEEPNKTGEA